MGLFDIFSKEHDHTGHYSNKATRQKGQPILHLRVQSDGRAILMINGSRTISLNETAATYMKHIILKTPEAKAVAQVRRRFAVSKQRARKDLAQVKRAVDRFMKQPEKDPLDIFQMKLGTGLNIVKPGSPLHMNVHITYDDADKPLLNPLPPDRTIGFLSKREWEVVIERLDRIGVQYVTFCGGEPTQMEELEFLIAKAAGLGMAVGLETNGAALSDAKYLDNLVKAGLDSISFKFYSSDLRVFKKLVKTKKKGFYKQCLDGIKNALATDIEVSIFILVTKETLPSLSKTVGFLKGLGVRTVFLGLFPQSNPDVFTSSSIGKEHLGAVLAEVESLDNDDMTVLMRTPIGDTQSGYEHATPPKVDCSGGFTNMALEPNGDVLICRYMFNSLGNIITDEWSRLWDHPATARVRQREKLPEYCGECPDLGLCGGGCPEWLFFTEEPTRTNYKVTREDKSR